MFPAPTTSRRPSRPASASSREMRSPPSSTPPVSPTRSSPTTFSARSAAAEPLQTQPLEAIKDGAVAGPQADAVLGQFDPALGAGKRREDAGAVDGIGQIGRAACRKEVGGPW